VLYSFTGGTDGATFEGGGLVRDASGNLYGTTGFGGDLNCNAPYGCGTVYKVNERTGEETVLYSFSGSADGAYPAGDLTRDAAGNLYGTAGAGCCGVVFMLKP
jgi:uncharacterized repeat protein (TIGR03803 family)